MDLIFVGKRRRVARPSPPPFRVPPESSGVPVVLLRMQMVDNTLESPPFAAGVPRMAFTKPDALRTPPAVTFRLKSSVGDRTQGRLDSQRRDDGLTYLAFNLFRPNVCFFVRRRGNGLHCRRPRPVV